MGSKQIGLMCSGRAKALATCGAEKPRTQTEPIPRSQASSIICVQTMLTSISAVLYPISTGLFQARAKSALIFRLQLALEQRSARNNAQWQVAKNPSAPPALKAMHLGITIPRKERCFTFIPIDLRDIADIQDMISHLVILLERAYYRHTAMFRDLDGTTFQRS